jgi:hypothetical protein
MNPLIKTLARSGPIRGGADLRPVRGSTRLALAAGFLSRGASDGASRR